MIYTCPVCRALFEMGADHGREPCAPCYKAGWREDGCGNLRRLDSYERAVTGLDQRATQKLIDGLKRTQ